MKIFVKAKAGAKENTVVSPMPRLLSVGDGFEEFYTVFVKELPREGKANRAISRLLAEYFKVSLSRVRLVSGGTSKKKVFEIDK